MPCYLPGTTYDQSFWCQSTSALPICQCKDVVNLSLSLNVRTRLMHMQYASGYAQANRNLLHRTCYRPTTIPPLLSLIKEEEEDIHYVHTASKGL